MIVAYGMTDLDLSQSNMNFTYHGERRYTRILPLLSYADPPSEKIFDGLETLDFHLNQVREGFISSVELMFTLFLDLVCCSIK